MSKVRRNHDIGPGREGFCNPKTRQQPHDGCTRVGIKRRPAQIGGQATQATRRQKSEAGGAINCPTKVAAHSSVPNPTGSNVICCDRANRQT
ncbi:unnamed protein product [Protopolystoma xenopodis]|uniref:Uncharacterized protein n=1 Tax=Protopolystoma xenopodis TaxID=117903 RepID=A0A448X993_9PLAT|nr:unnamed protein product [Protopolystoma xenopodis]